MKNRNSTDFENNLVSRGISGRSGDFAVLFLPDFALQSAIRMEQELEERPCVLAEECGRKVIAFQVNASARESGVVPGMTIPQVLARSPEAIVRERSPQDEERTREVLVAAAFTFSPRVEETAEGICTIDLTGVSQKGRIERAEQLVGELLKIGLAAKIGFGSNPLLALFAAKRANPIKVVENQKKFLADLPLEVADPPPSLRKILHQWGVHKLGALAALSREEIANRLGKEGIELWDRANGRGERMLRLTVLPEKFEETIELEQEVERLEPLLFLLRRFIGQLTLRLAATWQVAEEVKLALGLSDDSSCARLFRLPEPSRNPELLFRMLHTYLENVRTEYPIVKIDLWMKPCRPVVKQNDLFEATVKDAHGFADTLARLAAIVGAENVGSPRLEPTHRPDAFRLEPLKDVGAHREIPKNQPDDDCFEKPPMRRYRPPIPARVWLEKGRPVHLQSIVASGRIQSAEGPWRLSGNWWDPVRWARDEWDIQLVRGGCYRLVRERKEWFVEGEAEEAEF